MNKNLKQYLLILVLFIVGLVGCAWKSSTKQDHNNCIKEMQEQLPDWYENVWTEEFSEAMMSEFRYSEYRIDISLVLYDDVKDYSATIEEAFELLDRNDDYCVENEKHINVGISIGRNIIVSPRVDITNEMIVFGGDSEENSKLKSGIGMRYCMIQQTNNNASFPYISKRFSNHIDAMYLPIFLNDLDSFYKFDNVDVVYVEIYNESQKDDFDQFVSDMEERGIEVIVK